MSCLVDGPRQRGTSRRHRQPLPAPRVAALGITHSWLLNESNVRASQYTSIDVDPGSGAIFTRAMIRGLVLMRPSPRSVTRSDIPATLVAEPGAARRPATFPQIRGSAAHNTHATNTAPAPPTARAPG